MKHVRVDPTFRFEHITPEGVTMVDSYAIHDLEVGDIVHYKTSDTVMNFIVTNIEPAGLPNFDPNLRTVHLDFLKPNPAKPAEIGPERRKWRTGRSVGRTIYAMSGDIPGDSDTLIGVMDTPALAEAAVEGHNAVLFGDSNSNLWGRGN